MVCVNCKASIPDGSLFCMQCGTKQPVEDQTVYAGGVNEAFEDATVYSGGVATPSDDATIYVGSTTKQDENATVLFRPEETKQPSEPEETQEPETAVEEQEPPAEEPEEAPETETPSDACDSAFVDASKQFEEVQEAAEEAVDEETAAPKKLNGKALLFAGIGVAVVVLGVILALVLGGGKKDGKSPSYALYIKDEEMFYSSMKKDGEWQVTDRMIDYDMDEDDIANYVGDAIGVYSAVSSDGKLIFYPDRISETAEGAALYVRSLVKEDEEPVKIDSDITVYAVSEDANLVTYLKGEASNLYQYNRKTENKEKIASGVQRFYVSEDGKKIAYMNEDSDLYLVTNGTEKEKLDSKVDSVYSFSEDFKTVYYEKDDSLYKLPVGGDKVKVASDFYSVLRIYENGEIYYVQEEASEGKLADYINDDLAAADAAVTEPEYPEEPYFWDFETDAEYEAAYEEYEAAYEEYNAAYDEYYEKLMRDELRAELEDYPVYWSTYTLCHFDGKETTTTLSESFTYDWSTMSYALDAAVMVYGTGGNAGKVKISEVYDIYDAETQVMEMLERSGAVYLAQGAVSTELDVNDASAFNLSDDGKVLYYIDNVPEDDDHGELYRIDISGGKVGEAKLYDEDVYAYQLDIAEDNAFFYFKDVGDEIGELYQDGELVDYDVYLNVVEYKKETGRVIYYVDWSDEDGCGTLKISEKGKAVKIEDDVADFVSLPNGAVLYLYEYDMDHYNGELLLYQKGESIEIDDDVIALVPIYEGRYRGQYYGW